MTRAGLFALVFVGAAALQVHRSAEGPRSVEGLDCRRAGVVAGTLRCGSELPAKLSRVCSQAGLPAPPRERDLRAGDVLDAAACMLGTPPRRMPPDELAALGLPINVNEASTADLDSLPGIGPKMATRIIEGRPYARFEDLLSVRGIGPKRLADLQPRARLHWD